MENGSGKAGQFIENLAVPGEGLSLLTNDRRCPGTFNVADSAVTVQVKLGQGPGGKSTHVGRGILPLNHHVKDIMQRWPFGQRKALNRLCEAVFGENGEQRGDSGDAECDPHDFLAAEHVPERPEV